MKETVKDTWIEALRYSSGHERVRRKRIPKLLDF